MPAYSFNGIPVLSLPAAISSTPSNGLTLPWNGSAKPYQWGATLTVTAQSQSGVNTRQKFTYNGLDVNVGMWVGNLATGLAWQIVAISAKSSTSVTCTLQDINRYNTYRDTTHTGNGKPTTGNYVIFSLSESGLPVIDPTPSGVSAIFTPQVVSRFQYINVQNDFVLTQPDGSSVAPATGLVNGGSGYESGGSGTFFNVPLTGGSGTGIQATLVVNSGVIASVKVTYAGSGYVTGDTLGVNNTSLGGTGSGFVAGVTFVFAYGDTIAIDEATGLFVLTDSSHLNVIGTVTSTDDTGSIFTINAIQKLNDQLNSLPGVVGDLIYTDPNNAGGLTTTPGGTEVYLKIRNSTQSTTVSSTFALPSTVVATAGYTFNVNNVLATVGGTGTLTDINNAINAIQTTTGVSSVVSGAGPSFLQVTAVDARQIAFEDIAGNAVSLSGLISVENGIKAVGMFITNSRQTASFASVIGFTSPQVSATTWTVVHDGNTENYICQIFDNTGAVLTPDTITTIDVNTVQITFANAQAGTAQLSLFVPQPI